MSCSPNNRNLYEMLLLGDERGIGKENLAFSRLIGIMRLVFDLGLGTLDRVAALFHCLLSPFFVYGRFLFFLSHMN